MSFKPFASIFGAVLLILTLGFGTVSSLPSFALDQGALAQNAPPVPPNLWPKIRADLAQRTRRSESQFKLQDATPQTWPDSCLGLPRPEELCAQVLVPGWIVQATDGKTIWTYRSNQNGAVFRLAP
jgi:hypothetical protein